jgi:hypothetical protein
VGGVYDLVKSLKDLQAITEKFRYTAADTGIILSKLQLKQTALPSPILLILLNQIIF